MLVDSRSTHNFMNERVASLLQFPVAPAEPFQVKVASGRSMNCRGGSKEFQWRCKVLHSSLLFMLCLSSVGNVVGNAMVVEDQHCHLRLTEFENRF